MYICSSGHEEIVYLEINCPLCEALQETEGAEVKIADLEKELEDLANDAAECVTT